MKKSKPVHIGLIILMSELVQLSDSQGFHCGQCSREGNCESVKGVYVLTVMSKGYNPVVTIPPWACNINVTEASASSNYLALKDSDGNYILNGHWSVETPGTYEGAGTSFRYGRTEQGCPGECISATGPTRKAVTVQLLYHDRNPGIYYAFEIPKYLMDDSTDRDALSSRRRHHNPTIVAELRAAKEGYHHFSTPSPTEVRARVNGDQSGAFPEFSPQPSNSDIQQRRPIFSSEFKYSQRSRQDDRSEDRARSAGPAISSDRHRPQELRDATFSRGVDDNSIRRENAEDRSETTLSGITGSHLEDNSVSVERPVDTLVSVSDTYSYKVEGYAECSRLCGGGIQETLFVCIHTDTMVTVADEYCEDVIKPEVQHRVCNTEPCTPIWEAEAWSPCSSTCGQGSQSREVSCRQRVSATVSQQLSDIYCTSRKPETVKECYSNTCYLWVTGEWSDCSVQCDIGTRRRQVQCRNGAGTVVEDDHCDQAAPPSEASCDMGSCTQHWFFSTWTDKCSADCGTGVITRQVYCATDRGRVLPDQQCNIADKPSSEQSCSQGTTCGGKWFTGPWGECSQSCGEGSKNRYIVCMRKIGDQLAITADNNCAAEDKPGTSETCTHADCGNVWYMTDWSECSKTCDGGERIRAVQCISDGRHPSTLCSSREKPETSKSCNTDKCWTRPQPVHTGCVDKYPNCQVVVQARLCRYAYYQRKCCASCSNSGRIYQ